MPYPTNASLPPAVRDKIKSAKRRRQWRHVWNSEYESHGDESRAFASAWSAVQKGQSMAKSLAFDQPISGGNGTDFSVFLPIAKIDRARRMVSGYASTPSLDLDGEVISLDAVKNALPGYWEWRNIREMHQPSAVGVAKEANVDDVGMFLTSKITDDQAWQKCLDEVYKGYSIGGKKLAKKGNVVTEIELIEVSLVDRPANPDCRINVAKRAKDRTEKDGATLVKANKVGEWTEDQITHFRKTLKKLAKSGPPAARDGLSLPAPVKCAAHGLMDCKKCAKAAKRAKKVAESHIHFHGNVDAATIARALKVGMSAQKPNGVQSVNDDRPGENVTRKVKKGKKAKKLAKREVSQLTTYFGIGSLAKPSFLKLVKDASPGAGVDRGLGDPAVPSLELGELSTSSGNGDVGDLELGDISRRMTLETLDTTQESDADLESILGGDEMTNKVATTGDPLGAAILDVVKRAAMPTRAARMGMARDNMKKANKARKAARSAIEAAHKMHKSAYLAKAAGKGKKPDNDADDFDHAGAMEKLQAAYTEIGKMGTFLKAARGQIEKAAHTGQRGQEAGDSATDYEVPRGIKDLSGDEIASAGPGGGERGSKPPVYPGGPGTDPSSVYPGKAAKLAKNGTLTVAEAAMLAENARLEGENETLKTVRLAPVSVTGGRRPYAMDMTKFGNGEGGGQNGNNGGRQIDPLWKAVRDSGVDPRALVPEGEEHDPISKSARASVVGTFLFDPANARSIFDPTFKGLAGTRS